MDSVSLVLLVLIAFFGAASPAYGYIDPGSGSMLVQLLTGGVAGGLVLARLYWRRFKSKLTGQSDTPDSTRQPAVPSTKDPA